MPCQKKLCTDLFNLHMDAIAKEKTAKTGTKMKSIQICMYCIYPCELPSTYHTDSFIFLCWSRGSDFEWVDMHYLCTFIERQHSKMLMMDVGITSSPAGQSETPDSDGKAGGGCLKNLSQVLPLTTASVSDGCGQKLHLLLHPAMM